MCNFVTSYIRVSGTHGPRRARVRETLEPAKVTVPCGRLTACVLATGSLGSVLSSVFHLFLMMIKSKAI